MAERGRGRAPELGRGLSADRVRGRATERGRGRGFDSVRGRAPERGRGRAVVTQGRGRGRWVQGELSLGTPEQGHNCNPLLCLAHGLGVACKGHPAFSPALGMLQESCF